MPELPEVEAICRRLKPQVAGKRILGVEVLRAGSVKPQKPADLVRLATGRKIQDVRRRGKNILIDLSGGLTIRIHLRMTGDVFVENAERRASDRVVFELSRGRRLVFNDPRALGVVHIHTAKEAERLLADLGPEPLSDDFTLERFVAEARRSRQPAKLFLMDQTHVAGLGNIYAAEALCRAGIHPARPVNRVRTGRLEALYFAIVSVIRDAVQSTTISYSRPGRFREAESFTRFVYGRENEPCCLCGRRIRRIVQAGRSTYFCPGCQK